MDETGRKAEFSSIENPAQLPAVLDALDDLGERATDFARASRSVATLRAYRADWSDFSAWCESVGRERLPTEPETVGLYLPARARELRWRRYGAAWLRSPLPTNLLAVASTLGIQRSPTSLPASAASSAPAPVPRTRSRSTSCGRCCASCPIPYPAFATAPSC